MSAFDRDCEMLGQIAALESAEIYHRQAVRANRDADAEFRVVMIGSCVVVLGLLLSLLAWAWLSAAIASFGFGILLGAVCRFCLAVRRVHRLVRRRQDEMSSLRPPDSERSS